MYKFNFEHIIKAFLPAILHEFWYYYMWCIVRPVNYVKNAFTSYRASTLQNMATGQVVVLEYLLNDIFEQEAPTAISITDININDDLTYLNQICTPYNVYLSTLAEDEPIYLMTVPEAPIFGFQVNIFEDFYNDIVANGEIERMHAIIRKHKAAGFYYTIVPYNL